jgi:hypothetical protein
VCESPDEVRADDARQTSLTEVCGLSIAVHFLEVPPDTCMQNWA